MRGLRLALCAALAVSGCVASQVYVPADQAAALERTLSGEGRFLRVSMYLTGFYGDATKQLLTPYPPGQVFLLNNPDGSPISPGEIKSIIPAGTAARIRVLEFPTPTRITERVLYTPRSLLWVVVEIAGVDKAAGQTVLVLPPGLKTDADVRAELDRLLTRDNPASVLEGFNATVREAIAAKQALVDMPKEALEMALGPPESRKVEFEGDTKKETWTWPGGASTVVLLGGRVTEVRGPATPKPAP